MVLLAVTADTWIVTGLGFGIVLALLFCLVFILMFFGWTMQKATAPKSAKPSPKPASKAPRDDEKAAIAMALAEASNDDQVAVAYALYLYQGKKHDIPTAVIAPQARTTAWNDKSIGLNNKGF